MLWESSCLGCALDSATDCVTLASSFISLSLTLHIGKVEMLIYICQSAGVDIKSSHEKWIQSWEHSKGSINSAVFKVSPVHSSVVGPIY